MVWIVTSVVSSVCVCTEVIMATSNVAKELTKIIKDLVRDKGVTWFPELVGESFVLFCCVQFV